jgi:hypothetical protein
MTLRAGFDLVAEVSNAALLDLIRTQFTIQGKPANAPFEFDIPVTALDANAHLIVSELLLDLTDDDRLTLTLNFQNSSLIAPSPGVEVSLLAGNLTIAAPLLLAPGPSPFQVLAMDFAAADVTLAYTTPDSEILPGLAGTGTTVKKFRDTSGQAAAGFIQGMGLTPLTGVAFPVVPGANGSVSPLVFERLEVHCIGNTDPAKQAIAFFGILLAANDAKGDHTLKTSTAIVPGSSSLGPREVAISLSPEIFHQMFFCPAMAVGLQTTVPELPPPCGSDFLFVKDGVTFHMLVDSFAAGHVNIDGSFSESGFCYEAGGSFHGEVTFTAAGTTITPHVEMDEPEIDVDVDWYCGPAGGVAIGLTALINVAIVDAIAEAIAEGMGKDALQKSVGSALPSSSVGGFGGALFDLVTVTTEGLTIQGNIPMFVPFVSGLPKISLSGSVANLGSTVHSKGTYHYGGIPPVCDPKDFDYSLVLQRQRATFEAIPEFMGLPVQLEWKIGDQVMHKSGSLTIPEHCQYPLPLDSGGTSVYQDVHIGYVVGPDKIELKNVPEEGNFNVVLSVTATDPGGQQATNSVYVAFEGHLVQFEEGYEEYVNECQNALRAWIHQQTEDFTASTKPTPRWVPIDKPAPERVFDLVYSLATSSKPSVKAVLAQTITAHGSSFLRALFAARTGSLPGFKGKIKTPTD